MLESKSALLMVLQHVFVRRTVESRGDFLRETLQHRCVCVCVDSSFTIYIWLIVHIVLLFHMSCMSGITQVLVLEYECTPFPNWKRWIDGRRREACLEFMTTLGYWVSDLCTHIQFTLNLLLFVKLCSSLYFFKKCVYRTNVTVCGVGTLEFTYINVSVVHTIFSVIQFNF